MTEEYNISLLDHNMVLVEEDPSDEGCGDNCTAVFGSRHLSCSSALLRA